MISCKEMKELEKMADEAGLTYYQMMENAGIGAADAIMAKMAVAGKKALILCGKGNNGGDGYVVARRLYGFGAKVTLAMVEGTPVSPEAMANYDLCLEMKLPVSSSHEEIHSALSGADIIVDGLYGTGFHGELKDTAQRILDEANRAKAFRVSLDLPSGLFGDNLSGDVGPHILADMTLPFHDQKPIHKNPLAHLGEVRIVSIGIENLPSEVLK